MVGFEVKCIGNEDTIVEIMETITNWANGKDGPYEFYEYGSEWPNVVNFYLGIGDPPYEYFTSLVNTYPELILYAKGGYTTQCSIEHYYYVADFHPVTKERRIQHMDWEEIVDFTWLLDFHIPSEEELQWDEERIQQAHSDEEENPREEELMYNVYEILEKEMQEEIEQLTPYDLCNGCECVHSFYYGMFDNHDDLVSWDTYLEGKRAWEEICEDSNQTFYEKMDIPSKKELQWDEERIQQPHH